jgi:putative nucleotidyltransferase with HDIG domain
MDTDKLMQGLREENLALGRQNSLLAGRIEELTQNLSRLYDDLRSTYLRTIKVLAQAIDARDHYTHSHSQNVAAYSLEIAREMGLSWRETQMVAEAAELHDLGKIGIGDNILCKPFQLDDEEWRIIRQHPLIGARILQPLNFLGTVIDLVKQHHERYDGTGYPEGLREQEILLGARIIHLADAYETMRSPRAYRKVPIPQEEALAEIRRNSGVQFDPKVVEVFLKIVDRLEAGALSN